jgi:4-amino-4-deoxy-L-arabinose transferase-like glycosyltransferase
MLTAFIIRFWNLGTVPAGLTPDEAALGYNAYSILKTGKDEFGKTLPVVFKSFGDYKPGLYVYLTIPSVAVFGLNEFSTRLPSAFSGIITVYLLFLIAKNLFPAHKNLPFFIAFVAALNPYLIYFSRGAWEANVSLTLTLAGIYFFLKALNRSKLIIVSAVFFALTLVTYQGAKMSTIIVLILLIALYRKDFWKLNITHLTTSAVLGLMITLPIIFTLFNGQVQRLTIFSVFSYPRSEGELQLYSDSSFELFHSNQLYYIRMIMTRWFNFYSGQFLFFTGDSDNPVHTAPYQGVLLVTDLLLLPLGLYALFKRKFDRSTVFILLWLLLAPFSAAISRDQTNAVRSLNAAIPLVTVIAFGGMTVFDWIMAKKKALGLILVFSAFYIGGLSYFIDAYFVHVPGHNSNYWRYGYKEVISYIAPIETNYKKVVFEQSFNQPYIYFLFYRKYDPVKWQAQANLENSKYLGDVGFETHLDGIGFERVDWSAMQFTSDVLVITSPTIPPEVRNKPEKYPIIHEIKYINGRDTAFYVMEVL